MSRQPDWIWVEDLMPKVLTSVLIFYSGIISTGHFSDTGKWFSDADGFGGFDEDTDSYIDLKVTHWMRLPEFPL